IEQIKNITILNVKSLLILETIDLMVSIIFHGDIENVKIEDISEK
ncbi:14069_t:CDS:1, partial [Cetraspora pellucida]